MPNYDWTCGKCKKTFERFLSLKEREETSTVECECGGKAKQAFLPKRARVQQAYLTEVTYFENAKGEIQLAAGPHDVAPVGFEKKSTGLLNEIRVLEKKLNRQDLSEFRRMQEPECEFWEDQMAEQHRQMRAEMESMPDWAKELAREAMRYNSQTPGIHERRGDNIDFGYFKILN